MIMIELVWLIVFVLNDVIVGIVSVWVVVRFVYYVLNMWLMNCGLVGGVWIILLISVMMLF